jgi:hypothetical protein
LPNQNSIEPLGESSSSKNPPSTHVLELSSFSTPSIYRIPKESDEDDSSKENTQEVEQQVNQEDLSKEKHNEEVKEGEILSKYPRNSG